jgi:hypothetical protein
MPHLGIQHILKVWWHAATLFIHFFTLTEHTYNILYIILVECRSCSPNCFRSVEDLLWGAEPRLPYSKPTRYSLSHVTIQHIYIPGFYKLVSVIAYLYQGFQFNTFTSRISTKLCSTFREEPPGFNIITSRLTIYLFPGFEWMNGYLLS